jgi:hypothetical protein
VQHEPATWARNGTRAARNHDNCIHKSPLSIARRNVLAVSCKNNARAVDRLGRSRPHARWGKVCGHEGSHPGKSFLIGGAHARRSVLHSRESMQDASPFSPAKGTRDKLILIKQMVNTQCRASPLKSFSALGDS